MSASFWCFEYKVFTWFEIMAIEFWYKGWEVSPSQVYSPLQIHLLLVTCPECPLSRYSWSGYPWSVYPWPGYPYVLIPQIWIPPSWDTSGRDLLHALDPQTSIRLLSSNCFRKRSFQILSPWSATSKASSRSKIAKSARTMSFLSIQNLKFISRRHSTTKVRHKCK